MGSSRNLKQEDAMKTLTKKILVLSGLLLLAGCSAVAQDQPPQTVGPGWRHEQMVKAWEKGEVPGPAMMHTRGFGPAPMMAVTSDGTIDPAKMPPWCPYRTAPKDNTAK
jgi:hypothetical protein